MDIRTDKQVHGSKAKNKKKESRNNLTHKKLNIQKDGLNNGEIEKYALFGYRPISKIYYMHRTSKFIGELCS